MRPEHLTDDQIVEAAAELAKRENVGKQSSPAIVSLLRAAASTRDEASRHELARQAAAKAGAIGDVALQVLRVAVFALA